MKKHGADWTMQEQAAMMAADDVANGEIRPDQQTAVTAKYYAWLRDFGSEINRASKLAHCGRE